MESTLCVISALSVSAAVNLNSTNTQFQIDPLLTQKWKTQRSRTLRPLHLIIPLISPLLFRRAVRPPVILLNDQLIKDYDNQDCHDRDDN